MPQRNVDFKSARLYMLLYKLDVLNVIRKRRGEKSWACDTITAFFVALVVKNVHVEEEKKHFGEEILFLYKGNFIPGSCTLLSSPSFSFLLWAVICCGGKKSLFDEATGNFTFLCLFLSQRWEESSASAPLSNCHLYLHFQRVAIGWECLFSLIFSFRFFPCLFF